MAQAKYTVYVDDNFHYMDESERYCAGTFDTLEQAVAKCKQIVESSLSESVSNVSDAESLYKSYMMFGDDPFILGPDSATGFSAWDYAKMRSKEIFPDENIERGQQ